VIVNRSCPKVTRRSLLASVGGVAGLLLAGCSGGDKSDGQITTSPEASNAAEAIAKNYSENMAKKYANTMKRKR
jgi:hypothetical protein